MKNMKKRMFGNAGFTLVELIVVIAILAILAGVGTVGYSAYVKKANEAADDSMISEIEQALTLGAYAKTYAPGSVVGAVGLSKGAPATFTSATEGDAAVIDEMMRATFGANWQEQLQLKGERAGSTDESKILELMREFKNKGAGNYFDSVPGSSFYNKEGNTTAIVKDVDDIAVALDGVLDGLNGGQGGTTFSKFWGQDFHDAVDKGGLGETWNTDNQMAANLTVFAAANQVMNSEGTRLDGWVASWNGQPVDVTADQNGYVADIVMQYAQCVAVYNYAKETATNDRELQAAETNYRNLVAAMHALKSPKNGYVNDFNDALDTFWGKMGTKREAWQADTTDASGKTRAQMDAEALLASLAAVNKLESDYVNVSQTDLLKSKNAFTGAGADKVLDTMIDYASMTALPEGDYVITLHIKEDGTPEVLPNRNRGEE